MRGDLAKVTENFFYQFVMILYKTGEVTFKNLFVDGTKIEASTNKYTFVWARTCQAMQKD
jgi:transposase